MRISELPEPYKSLANSRRDADSVAQETDTLAEAFTWSDTPEGGEFWRDVYDAAIADDLPPISAQPAAIAKTEGGQS